MEKTFIWNPVYRKLPDTERTVIIQCDFLEEPTLGSFDPESREWHILDKELSNESGLNLTVIAWMEMPNKYIENVPLEFRTAAETRYFMTVSSNRGVDIDAINFYKIRKAIRSAAELGRCFCKVQPEDITEKLAEKLINSGYTLKEEDDAIFISWA